MCRSAYVALHQFPKPMLIASFVSQAAVACSYLFVIYVQFTHVHFYVGCVMRLMQLHQQCQIHLSFRFSSLHIVGVNPC